MNWWRFTNGWPLQRGVWKFIANTPVLQIRNEGDQIKTLVTRRGAVAGGQGA